MKKFIVAAIVAIAVIAIAAPISMGFAVDRALNTDKINAKLAELSGLCAGDDLPFEIRVDSYERGLFGAKSVLAFGGAAFDGRDLLTIESDMSFGWFPSSGFPFVSLVKSHDRVRLSGDLLDEARKELPESFQDGVLIEGDSVFTPYASFSGAYASRELNYQERGGSISAKPLTIQVSGDGKHNLHFALNQPRIETISNDDYGKPASFLLEDLSARADGDLGGVGNASAELVIKKIAFSNRRQTEKVDIDNISVRTAQTPKGGVVDSVAIFAADSIGVVSSGKTVNADKPSYTFAMTGIDAKGALDLQRRMRDIQCRQAENPQAAMEVFGLIDDIFALFDKGVEVSAKFEAAINDAPVNFNASLQTDPKVTLPKFSMSPDYAEKLASKLIINADFSAHQGILELFEIPELVLQMGTESGFVKQDGDLWKTDAHFKDNQWIINGKELPFEGLYPSNGGYSGYDDDYDDYDDDYYESDGGDY
ncbi:MAG: YdgA family protein [Helicobacteraceae bacterium]|jgi:uncharacterized protein YdgA (DUF945 family)|nr:YdgA family protein [Helicobacteraceae bacterium]